MREELLEALEEATIYGSHQKLFNILLPLLAKPELELVRDKKWPERKMPVRAFETDSGLDVFSAYPTEIIIGTPMIIPTGWLLGYLTPGYELQVRTRSSTYKVGFNIYNSPGTIDSSYRGPIGVIINPTGAACTLKPFEKIAQIVCAKVEYPTVTVTDAVRPSPRGDGGFGSTGR